MPLCRLSHFTHDTANSTRPSPNSSLQAKHSLPRCFGISFRSQRLELAQFQSAWHGYTDRQRLELLSLLVELADERIEYNFCAIFRWMLADPDPLARLLAVEGLWEDELPAAIPRLQTLARAGC